MNYINLINLVQWKLNPYQLRRKLNETKDIPVVVGMLHGRLNDFSYNIHSVRLFRWFEIELQKPNIYERDFKHILSQQSTKIPFYVIRIMSKKSNLQTYLRIG